MEIRSTMADTERSVVALKQELRREMRQKNRALTPEERTRLSQALWRGVEQLPEFQKAQVIAFFSALPDEPDTREALQRWSLEKRLLVPRVEGEVMHFFDYDPQQMASGSFGIEEPQQAAPATPQSIDLMVVPGVAFTASGDRMGRGKGFYDKYLKLLRCDTPKVGVCYPHQLVEQLPVEPHDVQLDRIVWGDTTL